MTRRHNFAINSAPLEKDITGAMKLLAEHDLMISADLLLNQLRTLSIWFKVSIQIVVFQVYSPIPYTAFQISPTSI